MSSDLSIGLNREIRINRKTREPGRQLRKDADLASPVVGQDGSVETINSRSVGLRKIIFGCTEARYLSTDNVGGFVGRRKSIRAV